MSDKMKWDFIEFENCEFFIYGVTRETNIVFKIYKDREIVIEHSSENKRIDITIKLEEWDEINLIAKMYVKNEYLHLFNKGYKYG